MSYPGNWPLFDDAVRLEEAQSTLIKADLSDGLPLVPPTADRLSAMLEDVAEPDTPFGHMPPMFGELTPATVAYNCVMAGGRSGALPVVLTAAQACLDETFNLLGLATTTGSPAVATVIHGPVAEDLDVRHGINCLGPGNPANATIGRAISLVLRNIGGMRSGTGDMATMGQPGKYSFCFSEDPTSPFPSLLSRASIPPGENSVTVLGISGTIEVLPSHHDGNWDTPEAILDPVIQAMHAAWLVGGGARKPDIGEQILLLPPELAALIATRNWTLLQIQSYIYEKAEGMGAGPIAASPDDIIIIVTGGPGTKMTVLPPWGGGTRTVTRPLRVL